MSEPRRRGLCSMFSQDLTLLLQSWKKPCFICLQIPTLGALYTELRQAGEMSKPYPSWKDVCNLPYLDACTQEDIRLHPSLSLPLERVVSAGGLAIRSSLFPESTIVGMSPYGVDRPKGTFGEDADAWNLDRWILPAELRKKREDTPLTVSLSYMAMTQMLTTQFGAGRRACLGKHVAMLEVKKIVPVLVLQYDVSEWIYLSTSRKLTT